MARPVLEHRRAYGAIAVDQYTLHPSRYQDEDDENDIIVEPIKETRYDRAREAVRQKEAKLNEAMAAGRKDIAVLVAQLGQARKRLDVEIDRSRDDNARKWEGIDEWRAGEGRATYNSKRRKKRALPNDDLSHLTPEQRKQRKDEQRLDWKFMDRKRKAGWTEPQITAAMITRLAEREAKRAQETEIERQTAVMEADKNFGMFSP